VTQLPTVHPGTPAYMGVRVTLCVLRETDKALQVTLDALTDGPRAWLPKSAVHRLQPNTWSGPELMTVKVWAFARLKSNLEQQ
jgi:hypothetical protein